MDVRAIGSARRTIAVSCQKFEHQRYPCGNGILAIFIASGEGTETYQAGTIGQLETSQGLVSISVVLETLLQDLAWFLRLQTQHRDLTRYLVPMPVCEDVKELCLKVFSDKNYVLKCWRQQDIDRQPKSGGGERWARKI
jgi:hypothetical protein